MKLLPLLLVALPVLAFPGIAGAGQPHFIPPSSFPPLKAASIAAMDATEAKMLKQPGVARVGFYEFMVDDKGQLTKIGIARSSGDVTDDDEAIAAIESTSFDPTIKGQQIYRLLPIRFTAKETFYIPPTGSH
ncbi:energy transducer TonB family protein [Acidiphilium sp.]|uniref:energy transducer TonB family protein n=1 Tax=Acidiphilium sp. TaxID=527 RepID=UPI003CFBE7BA